MRTLLEIYHQDEEAAHADFAEAKSEHAVTGQSSPTLAAIAYAHVRGYHRTCQDMIHAAAADVRRQAIASIDAEAGPEDVELPGGWRATTDHAASSHGQPVYVAESCSHGQGVAHSIDTSPAGFAGGQGRTPQQVEDNATAMLA